MNKDELFLYRYTDIACLIEILKTKTLTLLSPDKWDDGNDAYFINEYKRQIRAKTVLALCFSKSSETYHHWSVFSKSNSGVYISFRKEGLLSDLNGSNLYRHELVEYRQLAKIESVEYIHNVNRLPFIKRWPYRGEEEYRIVYTNMNKIKEFEKFPFEINCIDKIVLSPWLHKSLFSPMKDLIMSIPGCDRLRINQSTLIGNDKWKSYAKFLEEAGPIA